MTLKAFIGGISVDFIAGFGGCINNIRINRKEYDLATYNNKLVNVNMDGCPEETESLRPCHKRDDVIIYNGTGSSTLDHGLQSFTGRLSLSCVHTWGTGSEDK